MVKVPWPLPIRGTGEAERMDTSNLTWRDKVAILDVTARIAAGMFLSIALFSELVVVVIRH